MKRALTAAEMRTAEEAAADLHGMPSSILMENAGAQLAECALQLAAPGGRFFVFCGGGNNGGDGLVAARRLVRAGRSVFVELVGDVTSLRREPKRNLVALKSLGVTPAPIPNDPGAGAGDVVIDALLGTGLNRAPEGAHAEAIHRMASLRASGAKLVAADVPSGLHSDSGKAFVPAVHADLTVSFSHAKVGLLLEPGASLAGTLRTVDIGIPEAAFASLKAPATFLVEEADVSSRLPARRADTHKGTYGHVLVVAGSWGKTGAAALAASAALRSGAGLVTVATRPEALVPVLSHAPELMGVELISDGGLGLGDLNSLLEATEGKKALVIGPGIPLGPETGKLIGALLEELEVPCVIDADGLNALANDLSVLKRAKGPLVLTPHPGEMARLAGQSTAEVQEDRLRVARGFCAAHQVALVLKGARTLTALEDGTVYVNPTGNPGMATAGSGDVLSGVLGGFLAQGLSVEDAALTGVFAHGLAGDLGAARTGQLGLTASDVLESLGEVWKRWSR